MQISIAHRKGHNIERIFVAELSSLLSRSRGAKALNGFKTEQRLAKTGVNGAVAIRSQNTWNAGQTLDAESCKARLRDLLGNACAHLRQQAA